LNYLISGREYDQYGNLHQWWNNKTIGIFKNRTECVVTQYSKYEINNKHLNGKQTLGMKIFRTEDDIYTYKPET
jgi:Predicted metalloendopeptidase